MGKRKKPTLIDAIEQCNTPSPPGNGPIDGKWNVVRTIGAGGFGAVVEARPTVEALKDPQVWEFLKRNAWWYNGDTLFEDDSNRNYLLHPRTEEELGHIAKYARLALKVLTRDIDHSSVERLKTEYQVGSRLGPGDPRLPDILGLYHAQIKVPVRYEEDTPQNNGNDVDIKAQTQTLEEAVVAQENEGITATAPGQRQDRMVPPDATQQPDFVPANTPTNIEDELAKLARMDLRTIHYLPMEWISATDIIGKRRNMRIEDAIELGLQVTGALKRMHYEAKTSHQDVKPDNVIIAKALKGEEYATSPPDEKLYAVLVDLGISKDTVTQKNVTGDKKPIMGTPAFMSLQQWQGEREFSNDYYALGATEFTWLASERDTNGEEFVCHPYADPKNPDQGQMDIFSGLVKGTALPISQLRVEAHPIISMIIGTALAREESYRSNILHQEWRKKRIQFVSPRQTDGKIAPTQQYYHPQLISREFANPSTRLRIWQHAKETLVPALLDTSRFAQYASGQDYFNKWFDALDYAPFVLMKGGVTFDEENDATWRFTKPQERWAARVFGPEDQRKTEQVTITENGEKRTIDQYVIVDKEWAEIRNIEIQAIKDSIDLRDKAMNALVEYYVWKQQQGADDPNGTLELDNVHELEKWFENYSGILRNEQAYLLLRARDEFGIEHLLDEEGNQLHVSSTFKKLLSRRFGRVEASNGKAKTTTEDLAPMPQFEQHVDLGDVPESSSGSRFFDSSDLVDRIEGAMDAYDDNPPSNRGDARKALRKLKGLQGSVDSIKEQHPDIAEQYGSMIKEAEATVQKFEASGRLTGKLPELEQRVSAYAQTPSDTTLYDSARAFMQALEPDAAAARETNVDATAKFYQLKAELDRASTRMPAVGNGQPPFGQPPSVEPQQAQPIDEVCDPVRSGELDGLVEGASLDLAPDIVASVEDPRQSDVDVTSYKQGSPVRGDMIISAEDPAQSGIEVHQETGPTATGQFRLAFGEKNYDQAVQFVAGMTSEQKARYADQIEVARMGYEVSAEQERLGDYQSSVRQMQESGMWDPSVVEAHRQLFGASEELDNLVGQLETEIGPPSFDIDTDSTQAAPYTETMKAITGYLADPNKIQGFKEQIQDKTKQVEVRHAELQ